MAAVDVLTGVISQVNVGILSSLIIVILSLLRDPNSN